MIDTYIEGLGTVRSCVDCDCLVAGGPTRCKRCAKDWERKFQPRWHRWRIWRGYFHRRLCAKIDKANSPLTVKTGSEGLEKSP